MADMTDSNDMTCSERLIVGLIRLNAKGKYFEKNFCGKAAGEVR
jgi:hypothetical protein